MSDPAAWLGALPLDEEEQRKRALAINAPRLLGPLAELRGTSAPPPSPAPLADASRNQGTMLALAPKAREPLGTIEPPDIRPSPSSLAISPAPSRIQPPKGSLDYLREQGEPQLHGFKKGLDILGRILTPEIEREIPGTPGRYRQELSRAEAEEARQLGIRKEQAGIAQTEARTRQLETPKSEKPESLTQQEAQAVEDLVAGGMSRVNAVGQVKAAGQKPPALGEIERTIADRLATRGLKDTPQNRDAIRREMETEKQRLPEERLRLSEEARRLAEQKAADAATKAEEAKRQFHPAIAQQVVQGMTTQQATRRLLQMLAPYKDDNQAFGNLLKTLEYRLGKAQADQIGQELAAINLTSLQQAGSVLKSMGGVRAARVLEKVLQHTPEPLKDSTKLMYQKLLNIDRATATFLADADKYGRKSAAELPAESLQPWMEPAVGPAPPPPPGNWKKVP